MAIYNLFNRTLLTASISLLSITSYAGCSGNNFQGSICWTANTYCPKDYAEANGQLLNINSYQALYSLMGNSYGGDGRSTFALPDLRGRSAIGAASNLGQRLGSQNININQNNFATHQHIIDVNTIANLSGSVHVNNNGANQHNVYFNYLANAKGPTNVFTYRPDGTEVAMMDNMITGQFAQTTATTNGSNNNIQIANEGPRLTLTACIAMQGQYPSRN